MKNNCIFCDKVSSWEKIIENKYFFSIIDSFPVSVWHSLIIPKRHILSFEDLNDNESKNLVIFLKLLIKKLNFLDLYKYYSEKSKKSENLIEKKFLKDVLESKFIDSEINDYNLWVNNWIYAWRTIHHLHIHIIPRFDWDLQNSVWWIRNIFQNKWNYKETKKLVRDNIPFIMEKNWQNPVYHIANKEEYELYLFKKIFEELEEVYNEKNNLDSLKSELWDLLEVFYNILNFKGISLEEIENIRKSKKLTNWWFEKAIILDLAKSK